MRVGLQSLRAGADTPPAGAERCLCAARAPQQQWNRWKACAVLTTVHIFVLVTNVCTAGSQSTEYRMVMVMSLPVVMP
eukprot:5926439-Amphidinium_carterae.2